MLIPSVVLIVVAGRRVERGHALGGAVFQHWGQPSAAEGLSDPVHVALGGASVGMVRGRVRNQKPQLLRRVSPALLQSDLDVTQPIGCA